MRVRAWAALLVAACAAGVGLWRLQAGAPGPRGEAPPPPGLLRLERGNGSEPDSLDPQLARMESALTILRDAYEGLTSIAPDGGVAPGAAESWTMSDDGRRYAFRLRPAARWSNGDPVTAADFVAAWRRLVDPATASQYAAMLEPVAGARAILAGQAAPETLGVVAADDHTLEVALEAPTAYFPALLSHPSTFPVHRPTLAALGAEFARPGVAVTNGAFVPVDWQVGSHVTATRNRQYWDAAATALDAVRYHHVADPVVELTRFRAGELDVTYTLPPGEVARQRTRGASGLHVSPQLGVYYYGLALDRPPFDAGPAIRRALAMAIDRETLARRVLGDGELPAFGWVPPGVAGYQPARFEWAGWPAERRLDEARRLYRAAGYSADRPLSLELRFNKSPLHDRLAIAVSAMWKEALGIETRLVAEEFRVLRQSIDARNVQAFRGSWVADYNDAHSFLQVLEGGFGINLPRYASAGYDALLARSRITTDPAERAAILAEAERVMLTDVPLIPLFFYVSKHLVAERVEGWYDNVMNVTYSKDLTLTGLR
jgi:ABC-type oligopeptide transport system substrate-binding subunit